MKRGGNSSKPRQWRVCSLLLPVIDRQSVKVKWFALATVMILSAPSPMGGAIKIVPRERIKILNVRMSAVARVFSQWGMGAQALLPKGKLP
jgi:uncharacterized membrane protein